MPKNLVVRPPMKPTTAKSTDITSRLDIPRASQSGSQVTGAEAVMSTATERRWAGIALLVVTLSAALVIAGLDGARLAGIGTMTQGVRAPVIGECLVSLTDKSVATAAVGWPASQPVPGRSAGSRALRPVPGGYRG